MWDWVLVAVGLVTALYWYLTWNYGYWRARGVHSLPGAVPGIGHMWEAATLKKGAGWIHCEMYHKGKGNPAIGIYSFREPALLLRDPALIQTVLVSDFSSFHDNPIHMDEDVDPVAAKNPFILKGQRWKSTRQLLAPAFSPVRIKSMFPLIQRVCQDFNTYMGKHLNEDIDVNHVTGLFTSEVVAKCAFALDGNAFNDPNAVFYEQGKKIWNQAIYNPLMLLLFFFFPSANKIFRIGFFPKDVQIFFTNLIKQTADYREHNPDKVPDNDYLNFLLNIKNKDPDFTIKDVVAQSLTFFTDGFETSSVTASFMIYELTINPQLQEAVRQEVTAVESLTYDNISAMSLLDRVFQETLRKYSVFSLARECTKDTVLQAGGHSFPVYKGQQVIVPVYALHHDQEIYPDPEKFDPDRFLPENVKNRQPMTYLGFGAGPRICIGYRFATNQVKMLVANIVAHFKLARSERTPDKLTLIPQHILPVSEQGIWVQFHKLK